MRNTYKLSNVLAAIGLVQMGHLLITNIRYNAN